MTSLIKILKLLNYLLSVLPLESTRKSTATRQAGRWDVLSTCSTNDVSINQSINQLFHLYAYSSRLWLILSRQNPYPLSILNIMFHDVCIMQYNITNCKSTLEVCTYVPFVCKCMSNVYKVELGERIKYIVWCVVYVLYYTVQYSTIIRRRKNKLNSKSINVAVAGQEMPVHESVFSNRNGWLPNQEFSYCSASGLVSKRLCLYTNM